MIESVVSFVKDYQTLIAGILAVGAAVWATRPVRQQLNELRVQSAAARRELIAARLVEITNRRIVTLKSIRSIIGDIGSKLYIGDEPDPNVDSEWAFHQAGIIGGELIKLQSRENDPEPLTVAITSTSDSLKRLRECLDAFHRPESMWGADLTDEQEKEIADEEKAMRPEFVPRFNAVRAAQGALDTAFTIYENSIRNILIKVDDELLK